MKKGYKIFLGIIVGVLLVASLGFNFYTLYYKGNDIKCKDIQTNNTNKNLPDAILKKVLPSIGLESIDEKIDGCSVITNVLMNTTNAIRLDHYTTDEAYKLLIANYIMYYNFDDSVSADICIDSNNASGSCNALSKTKIDNIMQKYDFKFSASEIISNYLKGQDNDNYYILLDGGMCGDLNSEKHSITSWYGHYGDIDNNILNDNYITIRDNILLNYLNNDKSSRVIYYTFKKEADSNYKLWLYNIY